jgi:fructoselysine-6-P-deglycase FrlB-like protein
MFDLLPTLVLTYLCFWLTKKLYQKATYKRKHLSKQTLMFVFGSGGHTTELLLMLESLNISNYKHVHLVIAETDTWSMTKITAHFLTKMRYPIDLR